MANLQLAKRISKRVKVVCPDGSEEIADVEYWKPWLGKKLRLSFKDGFSEQRADDFFEAFQLARKIFEEDGYRFQCYGASRNVWPSGMAREAGGLNAYRVSLGRKGGRLVDIFKSGDDVELCTVEEQTAFVKRWYESID